jgi:hypothetical protein
MEDHPNIFLSLRLLKETFPPVRLASIFLEHVFERKAAKIKDAKNIYGQPSAPCRLSVKASGPSGHQLHRSKLFEPIWRTCPHTYTKLPVNSSRQVGRRRQQEYKPVMKKRLPFELEAHGRTALYILDTRRKKQEANNE